MIWLVFLLCYKMFKKYLVKEEVPVKRKVVIKKVRTLPESIIEVEAPLFIKGQPKKQEEPKTIINDQILTTQLTTEHLLEKQELEQQLAEVQERLRVAEAHIKVQENTIREKDAQKAKLQEGTYRLEEEQIKLQYEQTMLQQQTTKLQQEKAMLQQENRKLQEQKVEVLEVKEQPKMEATTAIMQNLDNMFTLEDYKVLATLLKEKQKKKNEQLAKEEVRKQEQLKFAQLHEAYRSVR